MGARLSAEELERRNEENCKTSLVKLKPRVFDKIIENLDLKSFLALKRSCKAVQSKCNDAERGPYLEVEGVSYQDGRIELILQRKKNKELFQVEGTRLEHLKVQQRCKRLNLPKLNDGELVRALEVLEKWKLKAGRLSAPELACSPNLLEELIEKLRITEIECNTISSEIAVLPLWKTMNTLSTESIFPETILLEGNFEYLQTRFTDLKFETIARTLQEIKNGTRSLVIWKIKALPWSSGHFNGECIKLKDSNGAPLLRKAQLMYELTVNEENKYAVIYTTNKTLYINKGNYASYL